MISDAFDRSSLPWDAATLLNRLPDEGWTAIVDIQTKISVFAKDNAVLRLSHNRDYGFANYAELCINAPSPHFQQIAWHDFLADGTHVTLTEKLHPAPMDKDASPEIRPALRSIWRLAHHLSFYDTENIRDTGYEELREMTEFVLDYNADFIKKLMGDIRSESAPLADAINLLQTYLTYVTGNDPHFTDPSIDLGTSNIMIRKSHETGLETLVLSDPFSYDFYNSEPSLRDEDLFQTIRKAYPKTDLPVLKIHRPEFF